MENQHHLEKNKYSGESAEVEHFHGVEGIKKIYLKTLKTNQTILALTAVTKDIHPDLYEWLEGTYVKERKKKRIFAKVISPKTGRAEKYMKKDKKYYRKTLLIPPDKIPITTEINIFGNNVAILSYSSSELLGVLIKSKEIASTMRVFFELAWEKALDYQREWDERF
jgi:hypothetical protein